MISYINEIPSTCCLLILFTLLWAVFKEVKPVRRLIEWLGSISFEWYLTHMFFIDILLKFIHPKGFPQEVAFCCAATPLSVLVAYLWKNHGGPVWNFLWIAIWPLGYVGEWLIGKNKETVPTTFVSRTIGHVWFTFGIFCSGLGILFSFIGSGILPLELIMPQVYVFGCITSVISLCFGMGTTITGLVIRNRVIQICGFIAGLGGFFGALHFLGHEQLYVMAAVAVVGLIVPGIIVRVQNQK